MKQILALWDGDQHALGKYALTPKPCNASQEWLLERRKATIASVLKRAREKHLIVLFGGDTVHLPSKDHADAAVELLQPLAARADEMYGVCGTPYHVGRDGEWDRVVYQELGVKPENVRQVQRVLDIGGRRVWWAHHANRLGLEPWTEFDGLYRSAKRAHEWAREQDRPVPALVVGHHNHRSPGVARYKDTAAAICPCWALPDDYHARKIVWSVPTIGLMVWEPDTQTGPEIISHAIPEKLLNI